MNSRCILAAVAFVNVALVSIDNATHADSPLSPEAELASFQLNDESLRVELVVAEPAIVSPVAVTWDATGAMYVVEMLGYPVTPDSGSIKRLVDRDRDGRYESVTVFAERLNSPTGVMAYRDGILVTAAPDILFLRDQDDDGVADRREVMWTGFRTGNQQLRVNGLYYGLDNWIYGANGRSGGTIRRGAIGESAGVAMTPISIEQRDFRFHTGNRRFESISGMSQFGLAHDSWGNRFISWNHRFARQVMLEAKHIERNPQLVQHAVVDTAEPGDDRRVYPLSGEKPIFNQDPGGYFTSLSGLTIYRGDALGREYVGDAFAGESAQGIVVHRRLEKSSAAFLAKRVERNSDFLASTDPWFHPVNFTTGPDGALYVVDFYRQLVEHPQWAHAEKRQGVDWQVGAAHGRIWRVVKKNWRGVDATSRNLHSRAVSTRQLVDTLGHPNGWWRDTAQRLIVEQQDKAAIPMLRERLIDDDGSQQRRSSQSGSATVLSRLHGAWTLHGLGALEDTELISLLGDKDARIRSQAVKLAEERLGDSRAVRQAVMQLVNDPDSHCRFQVGLVLGSLPKEESLNVLRHFASANGSDRHLQRAILSSAGPVAHQLMQSLLGTHASNEEGRELLYELGRLAARDSNNLQEALQALLLRKIVPSDSDGHFSAIAGILGGLATSGVTLRSVDKEAKSEAQRRLASDVLRMAIAHVTNPKAESDLRRMGVRLLSLGPPRLARGPLLEAAVSTNSLDFKRWVVQAIADLNDTEASQLLIDQINNLDSTTRREVILSSLRSSTSATALLTAISENVLSASEVPEDVRLGLYSHPDDDIQKLSNRLFSSSISANRQVVIEEYLPALAIAGNAGRGGQVFKKNCLKCHAIKGLGGGVGPDLSRIGTRSAETLLVSILDPSREVSHELKTYVILTTSGRVVSGMITSDTPEVVTICSADGHKENILREDIEHKKGTGKSIMPEGLERGIDPRSMADLIQFLKSPSREALK